MALTIPNKLMSDDSQSGPRTNERHNGRRYLPPELAIDLEADNVLLRAALAQSVGAGVQRELISEELNHRIGNLLAVVQAVARHTFKDADPASLDSFGARLLALGAAQKLLIESDTRPAPLLDVVRDAVAPHCSEGDRASISGPEVMLDGRRAHALTPALHELATNAAKYGALSNDGGGIIVSWTHDAGMLDFTWREHDGPTVVAPTRKGFGSMLITRNLGAAFAGKVEVAFVEAGLQCHLKAPL
jgi:two-component sensor histidine kinase